MKKLLILLALLAHCCALAGTTQIVATVTYTNMVRGTTNGDTITVNLTTLTYTNNVTASPSTKIQSTNSVGWSATNTAAQMTTYAIAGTDWLQLQSTNQLLIASAMNSNLTVTLSSGVGTVSYVTNAYDRLYAIAGPWALLSVAGRVTNASLLVDILNQTHSTNTIAMAAQVFTNYFDRLTVQTGGNKTLTNSLFDGRITNATAYLTNALLHGATITNATITNSHFNGSLNATSGSVRSIVTTNQLLRSSEWIPYGSTVSLVKSTNSPWANFYDRNSNAVVQLRATTNGYPALWDAADPYNDTVNIGPDASLESLVNWFSALNYLPTLATNALIVSNQWSIANYWSNSANTFMRGLTVESNLVVRGGSFTNIDLNASRALVTNLTSLTAYFTNSAVMNASLTNTTHPGTNVWPGSLAFTRTDNSTLSTTNSVLLGTNVFAALSSSATIATIVGFQAEPNGGYHILKITGAVTNIIANQSGMETTAGQRIVTGTGGDIVMTNNPAYVQVIYDSAASRWNVMTFSR